MNDFIWDPSAEPMPIAKVEMHPFLQTELARQLADLSALEHSVADINAIRVAGGMTS